MNAGDGGGGVALWRGAHGESRLTGDSTRAPLMHGSAEVVTAAAGEVVDLKVNVVARALWTLSVVTEQPPCCPVVAALLLVVTEPISGVTAGRAVPRTTVPLRSDTVIRIPVEADRC